MKKITDYNKIRALLDRWYSGVSSPEEERMLLELLDSAPGLPPDLEADRQLLSGLSSISESIPEMPEEYTSRINHALEKEIAADKKRIVPAGLRPFHRKWIGRVAAGVAICFACAFFAIKMINTPQLEVTGGNASMNAQEGNGVNLSDDTLQNHYLALSASHLEVTTASSSEAARKIISKSDMCEKERKGKVASYNDKTHSSSADSDADYEDITDNYFSSSDESLLADNYRVVRDQKEADAIINSIFSRLESNVEMESSKLSKIELEYDSEVSRLSDIENVGLLKEYYHEKTPL